MQSPNVFMRGAIYLNFCSHVKDVAAKPHWKIGLTNCETRYYERRLILNLYRLIWRLVFYWLNRRDVLHTRMLKNIVVTKASIFSIDVHEYIYRLYYCATIWFTNHTEKSGLLSFFPPNRSSGSISRRWLAPEGLNFLGVNCQTKKNTSITVCYEIVLIPCYLYIMLTWSLTTAMGRLLDSEGLASI